MSDKMKQLEDNIAQVKQFVSASQMPKVKQHLKSYLKGLQQELHLLKKLKEAEDVKPIETQIKTVVSKTYVPITKYAYDQQGNKVKIYLTLEDIGEATKQDQIDIDFQKESLQLKIHNYKGANHIFAIKKLAGKVDPNCCKYLVKKNMISITLLKADSKNWKQLNYKEEQKKSKEDKKEELGAGGDPNESIMNMMKKMYNEGDENMKKTIAQAWTKANDKKGGKDDLKSFS